MVRRDGREILRARHWHDGTAKGLRWFLALEVADSRRLTAICVEKRFALSSDRTGIERASLDRLQARGYETCASCRRSSRARCARSRASRGTWSCGAAPRLSPGFRSGLLCSLRRLLAFAAAPLHKGAVATRALLEHATEAVGAEFKIVLAGGTARRPAVGDQRAACSGAIRANCGTPSGCDGDLEACRPPGRAWGRTRANDRTGTWRCAAPPPVPRRTARGTSSLPGSR